MLVFEDIEDVQEWIERFDYESFWTAGRPYGLVLQARDHCDELIKGGIVDQETVLFVLKGMTVNEIAALMKLEHRRYDPVILPLDQNT